MTLPHLLFVVGPTASGKSDLAVAIAERSAKVGVKCPEIINCDSVQFFAGVNIGAAKPGPELLMRAPHHLVGHVPVGARYTAGDFRRDALQVITCGGTFLAVGGSGFYVQALEKGMYEVPEVPLGIRNRLEAEAQTPDGLKSLYEEFSLRDPFAARKVAYADRYRILRALEILRAHPNGSLTEIRERFAVEQPPRPFTVHKVGVFCSRERLRERIELRTRQMLERGLIDEVTRLRTEIHALGLSGWAPLRSVGYQEVQNFLDGVLERERLEEAIVTSTMQLAKRQMTWFKREPGIRWFDSSESEAAVEFGVSLLTP
jgi:tRNA dimethylallyltransferase